MRTFIAIDLEPDIKQNLCSLIRELDTGENNVRWVKKQALHLTLKFCGDISLSLAESVKKALEETASQTQPFQLTIEGTGRFPEKSRRPRVLWVGTQVCPSIIALQKEINRKLMFLGFPKEQHPYFPHMTLGRVKFAVGLDKILDKMDNYLTHTFGTMTADQITFYQSILKPGGAEYSILNKVKFK